MSDLSKAKDGDLAKSADGDLILADPGDARGVGAPGYPVIGDTKVVNGQIARWDGEVWRHPNGKPAW
jgi:hypothetical protein